MTTPKASDLFDNYENAPSAVKESLTTPDPKVEEIVEEFEKRFGSFTFDNGGALSFTLWDVVDERVHPTDEVGMAMQEWLTTTLTQYHQDIMSEVVEKLEGMKIDTERTTKYYSAPPSLIIREMDEGKGYNQALTEAQTIIKLSK